MANSIGTQPARDFNSLEAARHFLELDARISRLEALDSQTDHTAKPCPTCSKIETLLQHQGLIAARWAKDWTRKLLTLTGKEARNA